MLTRRGAGLLSTLGVVTISLLVLWPERGLRADTPSLFEPVDGESYFGFTYRSWDGPALTDPGYGDTRPFSVRYAEAIGSELSAKGPSLFAIPSIWQNADGSMVPFSQAAATIGVFKSVNSAAAPMITWNAQSGWDVSNPNYAGITTKTIVSGSLDPYITKYAQDVRAYGLPIFIRLICGEVNGSWWRNCSPKANATLTATDFINAWQHVVNIFRQQGVTNVAFVWNVNTFPAAPLDWGIDSAIANYYPGDEYVDWTSLDHYDYGSPADARSNPLAPSGYLDPHYNFAAAHHKPLMVAEWGVRHAGSGLTAGQQKQWLSLMFDYFSIHPRIKAVLYFNYATSLPFATTSGHTFLLNGQVNYQPNANDGDHRLIADSGQGWRTDFSARIASSRFVSTVYTNHPLNSAQFLSQQVAPNMMTGTSSTVAVTMRNNGSSSTWSTDTGFALRNVGSASWGIAQVPMAPGDLVTPGHDKTFTFAVPAPSTPGTYVFQWRMTTAGSGDFGDLTPPLTVTVTVPTTAAFVRLDSTTKGTWRGTYGALGYSLANDTTSLPGFATVTMSGQGSWTWLGATSDLRALQKGAVAGRQAATWYSWTTETFDIRLTDGAPRQVGLYGVDWDALGRAERIDVLNADTGVVLDTRTLTSFSGGQYVMWALSGHVALRITNTGNANAVVSGLFFDPVGGSPANSAPTVGLTAPANGASFASGAAVTVSAAASDLDGSVSSVAFFANGSSIATDATSPSSISWTPAAPGSYSLTAIATDNQSATTTSAALTITVAAPNNPPTVNLTAPANGASFASGAAITVSAAASDPDGSVSSVAFFATGWVIGTDATSPYSISWMPAAPGSYSLTAIATDNQGATTMAAVTITVTAAAVNAASFIRSDVTTKGTWRGVYGAQGYSTANDATSLPSYAQVVMGGQSSWTWLSSTTDARALQRAVASGRQAATWYNWAQFTIDVRLTDGSSRQVALYGVDWDGQGRAQRIDVLNADTGAVLDTRTLSGFSNGQYLLWNVSGYVVFRVTNIGPANAIVNGFFLD